MSKIKGITFTVAGTGQAENEMDAHLVKAASLLRQFAPAGEEFLLGLGRSLSSRSLWSSIYIH
jgi:hypothetical protein